jgi:uncharacterized membrane protein YeiH
VIEVVDGHADRDVGRRDPRRAGSPSVLLRGELYGAHAIIGAALFVVLAAPDLQVAWGGCAAFALGFAVRAHNPGRMAPALIQP